MSASLEGASPGLAKSLADLGGAPSFPGIHPETISGMNMRLPGPPRVSPPMPAAAPAGPSSAGRLPLDISPPSSSPGWRPSPAMPLTLEGVLGTAPGGSGDGLIGSMLPADTFRKLRSGLAGGLGSIGANAPGGLAAAMRGAGGSLAGDIKQDSDDLTNRMNALDRLIKIQAGGDEGAYKQAHADYWRAQSDAIRARGGRTGGNRNRGTTPGAPNTPALPTGAVPTRAPPNNIPAQARRMMLTQGLTPGQKFTAPDGTVREIPRAWGLG